MTSDNLCYSGCLFPFQPNLCPASEVLQSLPPLYQELQAAMLGFMALANQPPINVPLWSSKLCNHPANRNTLPETQEVYIFQHKRSTEGSIMEQVLKGKSTIKPADEHLGPIGPITDHLHPLKSIIGPKTCQVSAQPGTRIDQLRLKPGIKTRQVSAKPGTKPTGSAQIQ